MSNETYKRSYTFFQELFNRKSFYNNYRSDDVTMKLIYILTINICNHKLDKMSKSLYFG